MKVTSHEIKELAHDLGSDLCGIAPVERFADAPEGFRPIDIYAETRSAVVIGKTVPEAAFVSPNPVPYTFTHYRFDCIWQGLLSLSPPSWF
jgi:hypothetical protein